MPVSYGEFEPAPELRPLVASYWVFRVAGALPDGFAHSVPLDGAVSLFLSRRVGVPLVLGPRTEPLRPPVEEGDLVHGVRLWPGAAAAVLRTDVPALRDAAVMRAVFAIVHAQGQVAIGRLAQDCGLSERHLRRRFVAAVGLSPKELARIRRLRASLVEALADPQRRWVELAAACGYADQAHLVREYRRLSGLAPEAFLAHLERIRHGRVTP
jgi:AraC-like DNA-binding protein